MYTVSDMIGVSKNNGRGLVIYLTTSVGRQTQSGRTFEIMLGTLGHDLRTTGGVVIAYPGDEDTVSEAVLKKPWSKAERATISKRPGLLIIDKSFDDFDPQSENWFHIDLNGIYNPSGNLNEISAEDLVRGLQQIFLGEQDMFYHLKDRQVVARRKRALDAVSVNPALYGFGIDVKKFISALR